MTDLARQPYSRGDGSPAGAGRHGPPPVASPAEWPLSPESLYRAELPYVWHSLRRLGVRGADLEDLTQEVFLRAFRDLDRYDPTRPLRPWLFVIAYRLAADRRQLSRQRCEVAEEREAVDPVPGPEARLETKEAQALILRALEAVAPDRRAVFVLHELNGHTMPELADALELPLNTAYSRLRLARAEFAREVRRLAGRRNGEVGCGA